MKGFSREFAVKKTACSNLYGTIVPGTGIHTDLSDLPFLNFREKSQWKNALNTTLG